jgi:Cys-tRNA(Pro) deacylase
LKDRIPNTSAVIELKENGADFEPHFYTYRKDRVTEGVAKELGVPEHTVIKTLVMEDDRGRPLIVLMHGDKQVSTKALARTLGVRSVGPSEVKTAQRLTGYLVGGISPFGTRRPLPVYVEETILKLSRLLINGGRRGFLVEIEPGTLTKILDPKIVNVAR